METKDNQGNSRKNDSISTQKDNDAKAKLEQQNRLEKLENLIEETNRQSERSQKIYDDVEKESKKTFTDIPMTNPSPLDMQNPYYAHNLIYKQINPLKRAYIPKGKDGQAIRDEINRFLKEGNIRGRDSRQAFISLMVEAVNIFKHWVNEFGGKQITELYNHFYDLNKKHKFRE